MRVAVLHAWSSLGAAVAEAAEARGDDVVLLGAPGIPPDPDFGSRVASSDVTADLAAIDPDVVLVATWPTKLPALAAHLGAFNVHPSLLPAYRGAQPEFWVVRNGEPATGISVHRLTPRFDAGPVVARTTMRLGPHDTMETVIERLASNVAPVVDDVLGRLARGEALVEEAQDESRVTRAPAVKDAHLAIRWTDSAASIERLVRAAYPYFAARATLEGTSVVVRRCSLAPGVALAPGATRRTKDGVLVGAADGALLLEAFA